MIRIDTDNAPRPLMFQGRVPVRVEGRKGNADLGQILRLAEEGGSYPVRDLTTPNHAPSQRYPVLGTRIDDPVVVVRAFTSAPVLRRMTRPRLDHRAHQAILDGVDRARLLYSVGGLSAALTTGAPMMGWQVHGQLTNSRQVHMCKGQPYEHPDWPLHIGPFPGDRAASGPAVRAHCFAVINGIALDIGVDIAMWRRDDQQHKIEWREIEQRAYDVVDALASVHGHLLRYIIGEGSYALPTVELHIEAGVDPFTRSPT